MRLIAFIILAIALAALWACSEKISQPGDLPDPAQFDPDTTYVAILPAWTEADDIPFNRPCDVKIGYDRNIYIADTHNDRVVRLSLAGEFVESYAASHPTQVAQDRGLDLLAVNDSSVILRRSYRQGGAFQVVYTAPNVMLPPPLSREVPASLYGIAASPFPDKSHFHANYYLNMINRFGSDDAFVGTQVGPGRGVGLTTAPLAINSIDFNGRYFLLYTSASPPYAAQVLEATSGLPLIPDTPDADIYRSMPGGYKDIAMDELGNIFVCMQQTSEVWKFSRKGEFILKFGQGDDPGARLNKPRGIDVYQNRIYIADTDNNRIICFEASISWQP